MTENIMQTRPEAQPEATGAWLVAALYHFARFDRYESFREPLQAFCDENGIKGTLLIAREGINGTVAGSDAAILGLLAYLRAQPEFAGLEHKESRASKMPFLRMKVRPKKEIVTMGVEDIDPKRIVGTYVKPKDWNALISDPETIVIDTRNDYETAIGIFKGAVDPQTKTFREFPDWVKNNPGLHNKPKIAMYCTGGIRCEKATAFMKEQGFDEVFHLKGGILKYLEEVPAEESLWEGACFVFDERVSVEHGLKEGNHKLCHACRSPITAEEVSSPHYEEGVSCSTCYPTRTEDDRDRYRQRQLQIALAKKRGVRHIGG
ncbi:MULTISPECIES: rhodanese-related sulfurtransferase [unclassified Neorhizobium]|uniref:oxygen-dependent tRNA uridine(34) hydroxylase TrhO n=2 Tax=unclassified Neorhizobium TaxID=2629175 RepID=UPI001FF498DF|nr:MULTISPECIES: rhodanese-related sulfurtransferase [unclassified Neorhizobium]MCJ9671380.1 rhodanese-related sulfurtransferase [Neorhizobium sp. SHOUNA12B]MCJ9744842.1 rhodanese-related sulfurtransferase [Neorhizobium sp. SHOUNA12A]